MAEQDIPEYVEFSPGDLIRAEDQNTIQRKARSSIRAHRHTRSADAPVVDASPEDNALQIATDEIADGAVTPEKLAPAAVSPAAIQPDAVTSEKLRDGAVTSEKLRDGAVTNFKVPDNELSIAKLRQARAPVDVEVLIAPQSTRRIILGPPNLFYLASVQCFEVTNLEWFFAAGAEIGTSEAVTRIMLRNNTIVNVTARVRALSFDDTVVG